MRALPCRALPSLPPCLPGCIDVMGCASCGWYEWCVAGVVCAAPFWGYRCAAESRGYTTSSPSLCNNPPQKTDRRSIIAAPHTRHAGISLKTQELFLIVFCCRYLDLFFRFISLYNSVMKVRPSLRFCFVWFIWINPIQSHAPRKKLESAALHEP